MTSAPEHQQSIVQRLVRRGFEVLCVNPDAGLLLPRNADSSALDDYYQLLKHYSFRLFLRDVIRCRERMRLEDLQRYCDADTARGYLDRLIAWNMVAAGDGGCYFLCSAGIRSFGDTFEWFVAQLLSREFCCPAAWGIRMRAPAAGGDYDVIAAVEESLLYIETKSSPPKHVDGSEVAAFLNRLADLRPQCSIFLEDTHLRMLDKIVQLFDQECVRRAHAAGRTCPGIERLERDIFTINGAVFITNSKPDLSLAIGACISHFLRSRGLDLFGPLR